MTTFADFVESVWNIKLLNYQKVVLNKIYEKLERGEKLYYRPARGSAGVDHLAMFIPMLHELHEGYKNEYAKGE